MHKNLGEKDKEVSVNGYRLVIVTTELFITLPRPFT